MTHILAERAAEKRTAGEGPDRRGGQSRVPVQIGLPAMPEGQQASAGHAATAYITSTPSAGRRADADMKLGPFQKRYEVC